MTQVTPDIQKPVEETEEFIHVRVRDPNDFVEGSLRTTDFGGRLPKGVQAVQGKLKDSGEWATQKFIFRKADGWTSEKAQAWAKDHRDLIAELSLVGKSLLVIAPITAHKIESTGKARKLVTEGWASTGDLDRDQEIIEPTAWTKTLESYMQNPVVRFMHQDPVGKTVEARIEPAKGLYVKTKIIPTDLGRNVWKLIKAGVVKSYSIAGKVTSDDMVFHEDLDRDIHHITGVDLYEISLVDVPANPQAVIEAIAKAKSSSLVDFKDPIVIKSLIRDAKPENAKLPEENALKVKAPELDKKAYIDEKMVPEVEGKDCPACGGTLRPSISEPSVCFCVKCGRWFDVESLTEIKPAEEIAHLKAIIAERDASIKELIAKLEAPKEEETEKREWDAAWINDLPDAAFAGILPGGEKDDEGKTVPRSLRKLPHHNTSVKDPNENASVDKPHLSNALARAPQLDAPEDFRNKCINHLEKHAKELLPSYQGDLAAVEFEKLKATVVEMNAKVKQLETELALLKAEVPPPPKEGIKPAEQPKEPEVPKEVPREEAKPPEKPKEPEPPKSDKPEEPPPKNRRSEVVEQPTKPQEGRPSLADLLPH